MSRKPHECPMPKRRDAMLRQVSKSAGGSTRGGCVIAAVTLAAGATGVIGVVMYGVAYGLERLV